MSIRTKTGKQMLDEAFNSVIAEMDRKYTIEEIRHYLEGCRFYDGKFKGTNEWNISVNHAIRMLLDEEDGIAAVTDRQAAMLKLHRNHCRLQAADKILRYRASFPKESTPPAH